MSDMHASPPCEFLLFETEDGCTRVECRLSAAMLWLPQTDMSVLFQTSKQNSPST
jgi:hypothetical protein